MQITTAMQNQIATGSFRHEWFIWMSPKDRATGELVPGGIWTGLDPITVSIDGQARTYDGAGQVVSIPSFEYSSGLDVKQSSLTLNILSPEITNAIRALDLKLAPVEVHLAIFNPETEALVGIAPAFIGQVDTISINESDTDAYASVGIVTSIRQGTRALHLMKSEATQEERAEKLGIVDEGFKYASIAGVVEPESWGANKGEGYNIRIRR